MRSTRFFTSARMITFLLVGTQLALAAQPEGGPAATLPPGMNMADVIRVNELNRTTVGSYFKEDGATERAAGAFDRDGAEFTEYAARVGLFADAKDFSAWWKLNKQKLLTIEELESVKYQPVSEFMARAYLRYVYEKAENENRADPMAEATHERRELTAADRKMLDTLHSIDINSWATWAIGGAVATTFGIVSNIGRRVVDGFFLGPVMKLTNTIFDPLTNPVNNAVGRLVNSYVLPRTMWWARMWSGERRQQKQAAKRVKTGKTLEGNRYFHPAMAVDDLAASSNEFYGQFMQAGAAQSVALSPEMAHARGVGMDLVFNQYNNLALQLTAVDNAANMNKMAQAQVNRPALLAAGLSEEEVDELAHLIDEREDAIVYRGSRDPKVGQLEPKIEAILERWHKQGVPEKAIAAFYQSEVDSIMNQNRAALLLASNLDGERFIPENHHALARQPKIQQWREQAREMSGFYTSLEKHANRIQKYYDAKGVKYNVRTRIQERGFPLGSKARPHDVAPVEDCYYKFARLTQHR